MVVSGHPWFAGSGFSPYGRQVDTRPDLPELHRTARLELELDLRLRALWEVVCDGEIELTLPIVAAAIRAAYGQGYLDACTEPIRGELLREFGYMRPLELNDRA